MKNLTLEEELDKWLESEDHKFNCIAWDEGQCCCLDKSEKGREFIMQLINNKIKEAQRMDVSTWKRIGKEKKYWDYFEEIVVKEVLDECVESISEIDMPYKNRENRKVFNFVKGEIIKIVRNKFK